MDGREVVVLARLEKVQIARRSRRQNANDFPPDESAGLGRSLNLIANRDPMALVEKLGYVRVGRMHGDAAHRDRLALAVPPLREGDAQVRRSGDGILEEQLEEISETEEQEAVWVFLLGRVVLLHHRSCGCARGHPESQLGFSNHILHGMCGRTCAVMGLGQ